MPQIAANVTASKPKITGALSLASMGSTLPTDAVAELDVAFKSLGYLSDEGIKNSNSASSSDIKAFGGDVVLSIQEEKKDIFKLKFIEALNVDVLKAVYGNDNVTGTLATGISLKANSKELPYNAFVIDLLLRDNAVKRIVIPNGKITEVEEITYDDGTPLGYGVTISAFPNADGDTHLEYIKKAGE